MSFKPRQPGPPATRRDDVIDIVHGVAIADPYRWLEDAADPRVQRWMDRQDRYARRALAALPGRARLVERFRALFYYDELAPPRRRGDRLFYARRHRDREKAIVYWRPVDGGDARVLFDPNGWSDDGSSSLGVWAPSHDGRYVAYTVKRNAADEATLHVRDVTGGQDLAGDVIAGAKYADPCWTPDARGFYYTWLPTDEGIPAAERPGHAEVRFHALGADPATDSIVYPATGSAETFLGPSLSRDGRWLLVTLMHGWRSTDVYFKDLAAADEAFTPLIAGGDANYWVTAYHGRFYIHTDEGAPRYRVLRADAERPARADWHEIVAESDATLETVQLVGGRLALTYLRDATSALQIRTLGGVHVRDLPLPGPGTVEGVVGTEDDDAAYFGFSSFTEPPRVLATSVRDGGAQEWARVDTAADTSGYVVDQVWYPSQDGTRISMFLIRRADAAPTGDAPTILYGYGGFNVKLTPTFSPALPVWLELGGLYAVANLRGGGEYGEDWHRAGMLADKQNVFDDFIAAAEHLIDAGWTRPARLAIRGGSNGGLLVGAAMTQRPELFRAVVCAVPLLDMVRYHLFGSGRTWVPEYGCADDAAQFAALYAYSPYHRVDPATRYPGLLMQSADSDDRVDPLHARKLTAAVQAAAGDHPALLRVERQAGHGGADLTARLIDSAADSFAFVCDQLRVAVPA